MNIFKIFYDQNVKWKGRQYKKKSSEKLIY